MTLHEALTSTVNGRKVVTKYDPPPIPLRQFDWSATFDDYDLGDPTGFGRTEEEALADLVIEIDLRNDGRATEDPPQEPDWSDAR